MNFKDKYQTKDETDPNKKTISEDAYAIGELLEELVGQLKLRGFK